MTTLTGLATTALCRVLDTTNNARLIADVKEELGARSQRLARLIAASVEDQDSRGGVPDTTQGKRPPRAREDSKGLPESFKYGLKAA